MCLLSPRMWKNPSSTSNIVAFSMFLFFSLLSIHIFFWVTAVYSSGNTEGFFAVYGCHWGSVLAKPHPSIQGKIKTPSQSPSKTTVPVAETSTSGHTTATVLRRLTSLQREISLKLVQKNINWFQFGHNPRGRSSIWCCFYSRIPASLISGLPRNTVGATDTNAAQMPKLISRTVEVSEGNLSI